MATTAGNQSSDVDAIEILPGIPVSDGIDNYPKGSNPPPVRETAERAWTYDEEEFKKIIGEVCTKKWSKNGSKTFVVQNLPKGYSFWRSKRRPGDPRVDFRFWGHPYGRPFNSKDQFMIHYNTLQEQGLIARSSCQCMICMKPTKKDKSNQAIVLFPFPLDQTALIMNALKGQWQNLAFKEISAWGPEEEEFASHGMSWEKVRRLSDMVLHNFDYEVDDWKPAACKEQFRKIVELTKNDINFTAAVASGREGSVRGIASDPDGFKTIMDGEAEWLREQGG